MDTITKLGRIKAIIAASVAVVLICMAAAAGYTLFSPENVADIAVATTNAVGHTESSVAATRPNGESNHSNTTQISSAKTQNTALSAEYSHDKTAANAAQKPPISDTAKPQGTVNATTIPQSRCQIEIICKTAAEYAKNHPSVILSDKAASGVILQSTAVEILNGDTAFDVLKRVCAENNISLEFTKTPLYNSYYIEGIGGLYEFDCGSSSGWVYSVNGERPSRSCSEYRLNDGDKIVFAYTCNNGADV